VLVVLAAVAAVLVLVVVAIVVIRRRQPADAVDSFRRQIDALSPEARRTVVEQVQRIEADDDKPPEDGPGATKPDESGDEGHRDGA
jgi:hypothetical protein